jgi:hypothetical protein
MAEACPASRFTKRVHERALTVCLSWEDVSGALWGLKTWLRHGLKG